MNVLPYIGQRSGWSNPRSRVEDYHLFWMMDQKIGQVFARAEDFERASDSVWLLSRQSEPFRGAE